MSKNDISKGHFSVSGITKNEDLQLVDVHPSKIMTEKGSKKSHF